MKVPYMEHMIVYLLNVSLIGCGSESMVLNRVQKLRRDVVGTWRGYSDDSPAYTTVSFKKDGQLDFYSGSDNAIANVLLKIGMLSGRGRWSINEAGILSIEVTEWTNPITDHLARGSVAKYQIDIVGNKLMSKNVGGMQNMDIIKNSNIKIH